MRNLANVDSRRCRGSIGPLVSVCIPTYKRPALLKRAVASVYAQTYTEWELLISDNEDPCGDTWKYLQDVKDSDDRVRVFTNRGLHGLCGNANNAFINATGVWIKPLHDDDVLRPECIERLLAAATGPSVVMVSGLSLEVKNGRPAPSLRRREAMPIERIPQRYVHLRMLLQDCSLGPPSQVMVRRSVVQNGVLFEEVPGIRGGVDAWWYCLVVEHGDAVLLNEVLVELHKDGHLTVTDGLADSDLEAEYPIILKRIRESVDPSLKPPPLPIVLQMVMGIRVLHYLSRRQIREAIRLALQVRHPRSVWLVARWLIRQRFPRVLSVVPRFACELSGMSGPSERGSMMLDAVKWLSQRRRASKIAERLCLPRALKWCLANRKRLN